MTGDAAALAVVVDDSTAAAGGERRGEGDAGAEHCRALEEVAARESAGALSC